MTGVICTPSSQFQNTACKALSALHTMFCSPTNNPLRGSWLVIAAHLLHARRYYSSKLDIERGISSAIYFGYMVIIALAFALLTGSIGFWSCFWFVRRIYAAIKVRLWLLYIKA